MRWYMVLFPLALTACKAPEVIEPVIPEGTRIVLFEEFTGKGCTNCPRGSREIENLLAIYDTNLVVVSIHAGFFANPQFFSLGKYDLRTDAGEEIFGMLAPNIGYPAAVVNRVKYDGTFQQGTNAWATRIAEQIQQEPIVDFTLQIDYDSVARTAMVLVDAIARAQITGDVRLTVQLTENGIVDAQDDAEAGGIVDDYTHNHVLRTTVTPFDGEPIAQDLPLGGSFQRTYNVTIDPAWAATACHIVAFVSRIGAADDDIGVLQAGSLALSP